MVAVAIGHTQGRVVEVPTRDGRRLYSQVLDGPGGGPDDGRGATVVFEAGAAASRSTWSLVQVRVADFARAVVYDRSGLGRSAPDPAGRTLDRMADDLGDVLDHYGPGPFVLVGHSAGGPIVRLAASRHRERISAVVLVDPSDEAADVMFSPVFRVGEWVAGRIGWVLARTGLFARLYRWLVEAMPADDVRADLVREGFTVQVVRTQIAQARTFLTELAAWRTDPPPLGDIPVTVISGARAGDGMSRRMREAANASHEQRAAASPHGRHVVAENSAHYVPISDAALVAEEIERLATP